MRTSVLIVGMVAMVVGAQGAVRQLLNHENAGLLSWLPGGFSGQLAGHVFLAVTGVLLAGWGSRRSMHNARQNGSGR